MSAIAQVIDGVITNQTDIDARKTPKDGSALGKDAFLQLLVAQMKHQDPLEPTSNTEYISQLATFSQLEEMQNVSASMDMQRANQLVGQYVFLNVTNSAGVTTYPEGVVDYVVYQGGKIYLSVNDELYNLDDLDTVADSEYLLAIRVAEGFSEGLHKLPKPDALTMNDLADVKTLIDVYGSMTSYQQSYIPDGDMELFKEYIEKYNAMKPSEEGEGTDKTTDGEDAVTQ